MKRETPANEREALAQMKKVIGEIKFCMMTTATPEGHLISRPMTALETDVQGAIWFFASLESEQTVSLDMDENVNLAFADPADSKYLSISGTAEVIRDREAVEKLWNPLAAAWFPEGKNDPLLCLIKVRPTSAEYWESPGKVTQLFGIAKAIFTRTRYSGGEHAKLI